MLAFDRDAYLVLLGQLVRQPAVVGAERPFFHALRRELDRIGVRSTQFEGLLVAEGPRPGSSYLSVHVDRHGLVCTGPNEFQYAAFVAKYRADQLGNSVSAQTYGTLAHRFAGESVEAYEPWSGAYLGHGRITRAFLCERRENVIFEVDGLEHVPPGTAVAYSDRLRVDGDILAAQLDNVVWVAAVVDMYRRGYEGTVFFGAQEEAGRSWRFVLEWFLRFDRRTNGLLVLDTSPFESREEADVHQVVLRRGDANGEFHAALVDRLGEEAQRRGLAHCYKDLLVQAANVQLLARGERPKSLGSTELGRLVASSSGRVQGATVQIPTSGYHTASESSRLSALEVAVGLLEAVID